MASIQTEEKRMGTATEALQGEHEEITELQEQIVRLKSLLSTKREQVAAMHTVLRSNEDTAEVALTKLKAKYEDEKLVVDGFISALQNEVRLLNEDAASLGATFAAESAIYEAEIDDLGKHKEAAEEEKKRLNELLRWAEQQKLVLKQFFEMLA